MPHHINLNGKSYHKNTLQLLLGKHNIEHETIQVEYQILAEAVEHPFHLPYLIEQIYHKEISDEDTYRLALLRVQIDAELHMSEDIQKYQQRKYVAQVIERVVYGNLMLEEHTPSTDDGDEYVIE